TVSSLHSSIKPADATVECRTRTRCHFGSGTVWWGEATDEPARADARPTENANCTSTVIFLALTHTAQSLYSLPLYEQESTCCRGRRDGRRRRRDDQNAWEKKLSCEQAHVAGIGPFRRQETQVSQSRNRRRRTDEGLVQGHGHRSVQRRRRYLESICAPRGQSRLRRHRQFERLPDGRLRAAGDSRNQRG